MKKGKTLLGAFALVAVIREKIVKLTIVSEQQHPLLNPNRKTSLLSDIIVCNRLFAEYKKYSLVQLKHPQANKTIVRIIKAIENEAIKPNNSDFFIFVPRGHVWVESFGLLEEDSNVFGPVD